MRRLKQSGLPFKLVTNQAKDRTDRLLHYLHEYGFKMIGAEQLFAPASAAVQFMRHRGIKRPYLLVHQQLLPELQAAFLRSPDSHDNEVEDCVVIGDAGPDFSYENVNKAFHILTSSAVPAPLLISLGCSRFYRFKDQLMLDVGSFVKTLEHGSDVRAVVIGKPSKQYFDAALRSLSVPPDQAVMIGDDLVTDVQAAQACGMTGILVQTGKQQEEHRKKPLSDALASAAVVVPDFAAAVDLILRHNDSMQ